MHATCSLFLLTVLLAANAHAGPLTDQERAIAETYIANRPVFAGRHVKELEGKIAAEQRKGKLAHRVTILSFQNQIEMVKAGKVNMPQLRDTELKAGDVGYLVFLRPDPTVKDQIRLHPRSISLVAKADDRTAIVSVNPFVGIALLSNESILFVRDGSIDNLNDQCVYVRGKRPYTSPSGTTYNLWECVAVDIDDLETRYKAEQAASKAQAASQVQAIRNAIEHLTDQRDELAKSRASRYRAAERQVKLYGGMDTPAGREKLREAQQSLQAIGDVPGAELEAYDARDRELTAQLLELRKKLAGALAGRS